MNSRPRFFVFLLQLIQVKDSCRGENILHLSLEDRVCDRDDAVPAITHHHAVGRVHRPWYDRQRPALFAKALSAAKRALDPKSIVNPGVLIDPQ